MNDSSNKFFKKTYIDSLIFLIIFTVGALTILLNVLKINNIASILFKSSYIMIALWFIFIFIYNVVIKIKNTKDKSFKSIISNVQLSNTNVRLTLYLVCFFFFSCLSIFVSSREKISSLSFFSQFISVMCCLLLFFNIYNSKIKSTFIHIAIIINLILCLSVIVLFFSGYAMTWNNKTKWVDLTLNFQNPNPAGEFCFISSVILLGSIFYSKFLIVKLLSTLTMPVMLFLLYLTSSRNPIFSIIICVIVGIVFNFKKKISKTSVCFFITIPIIYIFLIMIFGILGDRFESIKSVLNLFEIYGRYYEWAKYLKEYSSNFLFGCYYLAGSKGTVTSFVNSYLMVLISFGPIAYLLFLVFNYEILFKCSSFIKLEQNGLRFKNLFPLIAFLSIFYLGLNEGGVYVGAGGLHILGIAGSLMFFKELENLNEKENFAQKIGSNCDKTIKVI